MSEMPRNDQERDAGLAALYRASEQDEPPPALDDAIRAAARRGVSSKPRLAGSPFGRSWRVPMSIAAVLVLCVSLVTVMREEALEVAGSPRVEAPAAAAVNQPAKRAADAGTNTATAGHAESVPGTKLSSRSGSEPSRPQALPRNAADPNEIAPAASIKSEPAQAAMREPAQAFPGGAARDSAAAVPPTEKTQQLAGEGARRDVAPAMTAAPASAAGASADAQARFANVDRAARESERARSPAPSSKQASDPAALAAVVQPPEKWLERIEELRRQGRLGEAKASLAEFRKRYPDHVLPQPLKDWTQP